jgi:phosphoribosylanthranilate isomerase
MIRVKICGVTGVADAVRAAELGASAIGLVFWPASPRCVDVDAARDIVRVLPPFVSAVGVFVNQVDEARDIAARVGLAAVQFHGEETDEECRRFPLPVIKAVTIPDGNTRCAPGFENVAPNVTLLLDAHDPVKRGGTGRTIDWSIAARIARTRRVILSGGLHAGNVRDAVRTVAPYAIDVSSGVESAPGKKDPVKLKELFAALDAL